MHSIQFKREKMNNYMVICCDEYLDRSSYYNTIIEVADIPGLMPCQIRELDGEQELYYRLKYRTSVRQVLGDLKLTKEKVNNMISSMADVMEQIERYLLDAEHILWKSDCIFIDVSSGRMVFTYYPGLVEAGGSLKDFLAEIMQYVDKANQQIYMYIMGFYNLVTNPDCSLEQMKEYARGENSYGDNDSLFVESLYDGNVGRDETMLQTASAGEKEKQEEKRRTDKKNVTLGIIILSVINLIVVCLLLFEVWTYQYIWVLIITLFLLFVTFMAGGNPEEENPDTIMEEYLRENGGFRISEISDMPDMPEETTLLTVDNREIVVEDEPKSLCLRAVNSRKQRDIVINKKSIVLGSMKDSCDYVLTEQGISRMHAKIIQKEDGLYLIDLNSTNGTFLNDEPVISGKEYLLAEGDVVALAYIAIFVVTEMQAYK